MSTSSYRWQLPASVLSNRKASLFPHRRKTCVFWGGWSKNSCGRVMTSCDDATTLTHLMTSWWSRHVLSRDGVMFQCLVTRMFLRRMPRYVDVECTDVDIFVTFIRAAVSHSTHVRRLNVPAHFMCDFFHIWLLRRKLSSEFPLQLRATSVKWPSYYFHKPSSTLHAST